MTLNEFLDKHAKQIVDIANKRYGFTKIKKEQLIALCKELGWKE